MEVAFEGERDRSHRATTESNGTLDLGVMPCGSLALRVWPQELADESARAALRRRGTVPKTRLVELPVHRIHRGPQTIDFVIPASAGYE